MKSELKQVSALSSEVPRAVGCGSCRPGGVGFCEMTLTNSESLSFTDMRNPSFVQYTSVQYTGLTPTAPSQCPSHPYTAEEECPHIFKRNPRSARYSLPESSWIFSCTPCSRFPIYLWLSSMTINSVLIQSLVGIFQPSSVTDLGFAP